MNPMYLPFLLLGGAVAFAITSAGIPLVIKAVCKLGWLDQPNQRSSHAHATPTMGGIAIVAGVLLPLVTWQFFSPNDELAALLCASLVLLLVGIRDDVAGMSAGRKLLLQIAAAMLVVWSGVAIPGMLLPDWLLAMGAWVIPSLTVVALVAGINAFNLIDGIDGLSGGVACISAGVFTLLFAFAGATGWALLGMAVASACAAFLRSNAFPSSIFMGDSGSMPLGLLLSTMAVHGMEVLPFAGVIMAPAAVAFFMVAVLLLPALDMVRTMGVRLLARQSPFAADKNHFHHKLLQLGLHHGQAASAMYKVHAANFVAAAVLVLLQVPVEWGIVMQLLIGAAAMHGCLQLVAWRPNPAELLRERERKLMQKFRVLNARKPLPV